jgi:hypothetical protein
VRGRERERDTEGGRNEPNRWCFSCKEIHGSIVNKDVIAGLEDESVGSEEFIDSGKFILRSDAMDEPVVGDAGRDDGRIAKPKLLPLF